MIPRQPAPPAAARRGSALFMVLWVIALISFLTLGLIELMKIDIDMEVIRSKDFRAQQLAESGYAIAIHPSIERFDPLLTLAELERDAVLPPAIEAGCREAENADVIAIVHPNWWSAPPAILRGWTDRCLRACRAYRFEPDGKGGGRPVGLVKARAAVVVNTANTPQAVEASVYGDPLEVHWTKVVFGLCGLGGKVVRRNFTPVITSTPGQRAAWLDEAAELMQAALR